MHPSRGVCEGPALCGQGQELGRVVSGTGPVSLPGACRHRQLGNHSHHRVSFSSVSQSLSSYFSGLLLCARHWGYCDDHSGGETDSNGKKPKQMLWSI